MYFLIANIYLRLFSMMHTKYVQLLKAKLSDLENKILLLATCGIQFPPPPMLFKGLAFIIALRKRAYNRLRGHEYSNVPGSEYNKSFPREVVEKMKKKDITQD